MLICPTCILRHGYFIYLFTYFYVFLYCQQFSSKAGKAIMMINVLGAFSWYDQQYSASIAYDLGS